MRYDGEGHANYRTFERASYGWPEVRLSVQWKANCFRDEAEEERVASGRDDLSQEGVIERFVADLRGRGRITDRPEDDALARMIVAEYVKFPEPAARS